MTNDNKQQKLSDSKEPAIAYSTCCVSGAVKFRQKLIRTTDKNKKNFRVIFGKVLINSYICAVGKIKI